MRWKWPRVKSYLEIGFWIPRLELGSKSSIGIIGWSKKIGHCEGEEGGYEEEL